MSYSHQHKTGSHYDVLKNVVYIAAVRELQEAHPEGVVLVDTHSGPGVYDNAISDDYHKAAQRVIDRNLNAPPAVKKYVSLLNKLKTEFGEETLPGSSLFARELMRDVDQHRLMDVAYDDVEGLYEDAEFRKLDCYDDASLDYIIPVNEELHPIILIDPAYEVGGDVSQDMLRARTLFENILTRRSDATIIMWIPFVKNHNNRWTFPKSMKEIAKGKASVGRYFCSIVVGKEGLEGGAVIVANPTRSLIEKVDEETLEWMASVMNQGKADYAVEQAMKKKKKITPYGE